MARKRLIAPEIWRDPKCLQLSVQEKLIWCGVISNTDDEGIFEPHPNSFRFELGCEELLQEHFEAAFRHLAELEMIVFFRGRYAFLPNWFKHQALNRPHETKLLRPSKEILDKFPKYVEGWQKYFCDWVEDPKTGKKVKKNRRHPSYFGED